MPGLIQHVGHVICRTRAIADFEATWPRSRSRRRPGRHRPEAYWIRPARHLGPAHLQLRPDDRHRQRRHQGNLPRVPRTGRTTATAEPPAARHGTGGLAARIPCAPAASSSTSLRRRPQVWGDGESEHLGSKANRRSSPDLDGVGKTTLGLPGSSIRARLGIGDGLVLGMAVTLWQAQRPDAVNGPGHAKPAACPSPPVHPRRPGHPRRAACGIWQGPPPADLARNVMMLAELAALADADTIVIDSLKDAALEAGRRRDGQRLEPCPADSYRSRLAELRRASTIPARPRAITASRPSSRTCTARGGSRLQAPDQLMSLCG